MGAASSCPAPRQPPGPSTLQEARQHRVVLGSALLLILTPKRGWGTLLDPQHPPSHPPRCGDGPRTARSGHTGDQGCVTTTGSCGLRDGDGCQAWGLAGTDRRLLGQADHTCGAWSRHRVWSGGRLCGAQRDVAKLRQRGQDKGRWAQNGAQEAPQQTGQKQDREGGGTAVRGGCGGASGGVKTWRAAGRGGAWGSLPAPAFV